MILVNTYAWKAFTYNVYICLNANFVDVYLKKHSYIIQQG